MQYTKLMKQRLIRAGLALVLVVAAGTIGYTAGKESVPSVVSIPAQTVTAQPSGTTRVIYSLDQKQNDKELIALIDGAKDHIYFAIYTFTLSNVADALVAAKGRGVDVARPAASV